MNHAYPKRGYRALRKGRVSLPHQTYLITAVCRERRPRFAAWPPAAAAARVLGDASLWRGATALCWVLMPDHLHILLALGSQEPLSPLMQRVKAVTARAAARAAGAPGSGWWMPGFHDHALRHDADLRATARYVVGNPLRTGLVDSVGAYPFWDAVWLDEGPQETGAPWPD